MLLIISQLLDFSADINRQVQSSMYIYIYIYICLFPPPLPVWELGAARKTGYFPPRALDDVAGSAPYTFRRHMFRPSAAPWKKRPALRTATEGAL